MDYVSLLWADLFICQCQCQVFSWDVPVRVNLLVDMKTTMPSSQTCVFYFLTHLQYFSNYLDNWYDDALATLLLRHRPWITGSRRQRQSTRFYSFIFVWNLWALYRILSNSTHRLVISFCTQNPVIIMGEATLQHRMSHQQNRLTNLKQLLFIWENQLTI